MKAIRYLGIDKIGVEEVEKPQVSKGWALIKTAYAGICGSDMTIYHGRHPRAKAPLTLGHEFSGYICSSSRFPEGTLVTVYPYLNCGACECCQRGDIHICEHLKLIGIDLDGGMAEYVAVPEDKIYPVPAGLSPKAAAFIEPVGITVHGVRKGGWQKGSDVVIFGAGAIGLSTGLTLKKFGAERILIADPVPDRIRLAAELGFDTISCQTDSVQAVMDWTGGRGADFVYDCAGHQTVADILPDTVRIGGCIVIVAGYKVPPVMDFQKGMFREFSIQFVRNCTPDDFETASRIIDENYEKILNCFLPVKDARKGFDVPKGAYKVIFQIGEEK